MIKRRSLLRLCCKKFFRVKKHQHHWGTRWTMVKSDSSKNKVNDIKIKKMYFYEIP